MVTTADIHISTGVTGPIAQTITDRPIYLALFLPGTESLSLEPSTSLSMPCFRRNDALSADCPSRSGLLFLNSKLDLLS